ncbi:hypothetical protein Rsub_02388 [Raphidocelis subcapitata]|uniref:XPA C-terminal domain-containing protein n=1 Tax=Raphidocelis subcapitata TaxID=307507 RepID=A0A2V0NUD1_9CHLO|nr:hypothetical protein Rsub_02388 [Raphidocelis subcapitata]|eukprot:GBF90282.1 hypothetical protein Rsub_02388 [Raphidocelis subcapitata]
MAAASPGGAGPPSLVGACDRCGAAAPRVDAQWLAAFGLALCGDCRRADGLISKSKAKSLYLLSDADLRPLGSLEKANPQNKNWNAMRMYLASQVRGAAVKKHGSLDAIEAQKDARADKRFSAAADARKRGAAADAQQEMQDARLAARVEARAAALAREAEAAERTQIEVRVDPVTGAKRQRVAPELAEVEVEQI